MKNIKYIVIISIGLILFGACSEDFLTRYPKGQVSETVLTNERGVNLLLVGAYSVIDGYSGRASATDGTTEYGDQGGASPSNWVWGDIASDDVYKGHLPGGWPEVVEIERYEASTENPFITDAWKGHFDGVARANDVLRVLHNIDKEEAKMSDEAYNQIEAEARFLRAWFYFQLRIKFENVPYIYEDVLEPEKVKNDVEIWDLIEEDLQWGITNNMEAEPLEVGRASLYAAMTLKARVHMFQKEWTDARDLLDRVLNEASLSLNPHFYDNYDEEHQHNSESIFEIEYSVGDGGDPSNSGPDRAPWHPLSPELGANGYDWCPPSIDLFNAYKVDANGLPFLDTYRDNFLTEDQGINSADNFEPTDHELDPRVDWTIARRGIPYLDWGVFRGRDQVASQDDMGPFLGKKNYFWRRNDATVAPNPGGYWNGGVNSNNTRIFTLTKVKLWRAEVAAELDDFGTALQHVNDIRNRAADPTTWVMGKVNTYSLPAGAVLDIDSNQYAANYSIEPYASFPNKEYALKAVRMETRLECALEGMRFFDLVRWGIAADVLNGFRQNEEGLRGSYIDGCSYTEGEDDHWPIPQRQIDLQQGFLVQDEAYR